MNHPCLQFTRFIDLGDDGREIEESYGYRLYDEFDYVYNNKFSSFSELSDVINRNTVVDFIWSNHFEFADAITGDNDNGEGDEGSIAMG